MLETETTNNVPIKLKKRLGLGLIAASTIFLFNPDISVIDLLPDLFGYILLSARANQQ